MLCVLYLTLYIYKYSILYFMIQGYLFKLKYYSIVKGILGEEWLDNSLFRLGTSRLANLLLSEIVGKEVKFF